MKIQRIMALTLLLISSLSSLRAWAIEVHNGLGVFFSDTEFTDETSNTTLGGVETTAYIVLIHADVAQVSGYECYFGFSEQLFFIPSGPSGWVNHGAPQNHIVTFDPPVEVAANGTAVLCTLVLQVFGSNPIDILLGPSTPWGLPGWNGPVIVGATPDDRRPAFLTSGISGEGMQVVATINGDGVTSVEGRTWSQVKGLFQ